MKQMQMNQASLMLSTKAITDVEDMQSYAPPVSSVYNQ